MRADKKQVLTILNTAKGQINGIVKMIEEELKSKKRNYEEKKGRVRNMSLKDAMKAKAQGVESVEQMMLENKLNRLFYEDRKNEQRYGLHASAVLGCLKDNFCYREQVLSLFYQMNQGEQLPVKQLKIFAQGNAMHETRYSPSAS